MKNPLRRDEGGFYCNTHQYFLSSPHMEVLKRTT